ncbi:MAG: PrgI family protein [Candidatus Zambryskibacteria bacterium]|nr:PrgI family protein [Candidatus Zambryskibacteria bacterium]
MRFQVPQFIEVEDKIFGPLTFKQFVYLGGGAGICVILLTFLPKFLAILLSLPVVVFTAALAFYKVNEKPFIHLIESFLNYTLGNKLYIWKKESPTLKSSGVPREKKPIEQIYVPKLSESKLKELTWSLDIKENSNPVTQDSNSQISN